MPGEWGTMGRRSASLRGLTVAGLLIALSACADGWATTNVASQPAGVARAPTPVDKIEIIEGDVTDRPYTSLGDVSVTVNKVTIFNADPTREMVNQRLRAEGRQAGSRCGDPGSLWHSGRVVGELGCPRRQGTCHCLQQAVGPQRSSPCCLPLPVRATRRTCRPTSAGFRLTNDSCRATWTVRKGRWTASH